MTNFKRHLAALATGIAGAALLAGVAFADAALIYDGGGKFDKSFNEAAYNGAEKYKAEGGSYADLEISGLLEAGKRRFAVCAKPRVGGPRERIDVRVMAGVVRRGWERGRRKHGRAEFRRTEGVRRLGRRRGQQRGLVRRRRP